MHNDCVSKYINVGAGIGGGFMKTNELRVMKYHEAINSPDSELWNAKVRQEHQKWLVMFLSKSRELSFLVR
jgi:hypothetical protein